MNGKKAAGNIRVALAGKNVKPVRIQYREAAASPWKPCPEGVAFQSRGLPRQRQPPATVPRPAPAASPRPPAHPAAAPRPPARRGLPLARQPPALESNPFGVNTGQTIAG